MTEPAPDEPTIAVVRRIRRIALAAYFVFAVWMLATLGGRAFLGLTCSAAVTMISFLWLEEVVDVLLQPTPNPHPWKLGLRAMARFLLLGAATSVTIVVARFNAVSVLLGFSIVVVGIMGEALYTAYRHFTGSYNGN